MELNYLDWKEQYQPITNIYNNDLISDEVFINYLYNLRGIELYKVRSFPHNQIWSLVSYEGKLYIEPGIKFNTENTVNPILGYFITINFWTTTQCYIKIQ